MFLQNTRFAVKTKQNKKAQHNYFCVQRVLLTVWRMDEKERKLWEEE
jgi:hypothetical protein